MLAAASINSSREEKGGRATKGYMAMAARGRNTSFTQQPEAREEEDGMKMEGLKDSAPHSCLLPIPEAGWPHVPCSRAFPAMPASHRGSAEPMKASVAHLRL